MISDILSRPELFWFFIGLILFLFELVIPGFFIFFFGLGAWVTALVCLIGEPGTNLQMLIFATVSVLSLLGLRRMIQKKLFYNKGNESSDVEDEFTGKVGLATSDFGPGKNGKVEFRGTTWSAKSKLEVKEGQSVLILDKKSITLLVEPKK